MTGSGPRIRLSKLSAVHNRVIETLRFLRSKKGMFQLDHITYFEYMVKRGMLNPITSLVTTKSGLTTSDEARSMIYPIISYCLDLELIKHAYPPGDRRKKHVYELTRDGLETLKDWDDPNADGIWIR